MTQAEALALIHSTLEKTLEKEVGVTVETDLFAEKILDSLDTMIFFLNLEEASGVPFQDKKLEEAGLNRVAVILERLQRPEPAAES